MKINFENIKYLIQVKRLSAIQTAERLKCNVKKIYGIIAYNNEETLSELIAGRKVVSEKEINTLREQWKKAIDVESNYAKRAHITMDFEEKSGVNFSKEEKEIAKQKSEQERTEKREAKELAKKNKAAERESKKKAKLLEKKKAEKAKKEKPIPFKVIIYKPITQRNRDLMEENRKLLAENAKFKKKVA